MGLFLRAERAFERWWHRQDLPARGDEDYEVLERHWQGDGSELTVISDSPAFLHFFLTAALLSYLLMVQTAVLPMQHWYVLCALSAILTYFFVTASTEYRLIEWENYIATKVANLPDRQRLSSLQSSDPQGYYILLRRLLASRFPVAFSFERQGRSLLPIVRLWTPDDLVEKLWAVGSPLHIYLAYMHHSAAALLLISAGIFIILRKAHDNLAVKTVISEFAMYQSATVGSAPRSRGSTSPAGRSTVAYKSRLS